MKVVIFLLLLFINLFAADANMEIIKDSNILTKIKVIESNSGDNDEVSIKLREMIKKDLEVSCHFDVLGSNNQEKLSFNGFPNLLTHNNTDLLLIVDTKSTKEQITLGIKLYDLNTKKMVINNTMSSSKKDRFPFIAHKTAILINDYIKAPSISWMDRFVIFSRYVSPKESEIVIADYTLGFQTVVVKGGLNIFPKWADEKQESFYYTTYKGLPYLAKLNLVTKKQDLILSSDGMIVCSDISKDGLKLILTMAPNSQPDIYLYDVNSKNKQRITDYKGIDVGGQFINNNKIAFVSDRLKTPTIFVKDLNGSEQRVDRLIGVGKNSSSFSTYGEFVAFSEKISKDLNIFLVGTSTMQKKQITDSGSNEFPRFSDDGMSLLFIKKINNQSMVGIYRVGYDKSFTFASKIGLLQSIDW